MKKIKNIANKITSVLIIFLVCGCNNPLGKNFASDKECFEYVKSKALTTEKIFSGNISCRFIFPAHQDERTEARRNFGKCLINKYEKIIDDSSGTSVVSTCAYSAGTNDIGIILSKKFSASERMAEALEDHRRALERQQEELNSRADCIFIGGMIHCI